jgi:hypothetical protein
VSHVREWTGDATSIASSPTRIAYHACRGQEIADGFERRRLVIRLHTDGWNAQSIAAYLAVSRNTVHTILRQFAQEQLAGLADRSHARTGVRKADLRSVQAINKPAENPALGAFASVRPWNRWASRSRVPPVGGI